MRLKNLYENDRMEYLKNIRTTMITAATNAMKYIAEQMGIELTPDEMAKVTKYLSTNYKKKTDSAGFIVSEVWYPRFLYNMIFDRLDPADKIIKQHIDHAKKHNFDFNDNSKSHAVDDYAKKNFKVGDSFYIKTMNKFIKDAMTQKFPELRYDNHLNMHGAELESSNAETKRIEKEKRDKLNSAFFNALHENKLDIFRIKYKLTVGQIVNLAIDNFNTLRDTNKLNRFRLWAEKLK